MNEELLKKVYDTAKDYDLQFGFCPQCVVAAIAENVNWMGKDLIKAAHALAGGGALMGIGTCGALAGGLMVIGAKHGRTREQFGQTKALRSLQAGKTLIEEFTTKYGGISCQAVQKHFTGNIYDLWNADETTAFKCSECKEGCADLTGWVARRTLELIGE